ncbi:g8615 [Coccomyxa viridis]|uniref:G8615 protein n=1 Tax=Coccomyxa viridis TaxID=1274662 RepID=A0ABP1G5L8_9CHLO
MRSLTLLDMHNRYRFCFQAISVFLLIFTCSSHLASAAHSGAVDSTVLGRFTNETLGGLEGTLPASKAELRKKNAILQTEVDDLDTKVAVLDAKNTEEEAVINNLIKQVNQLTPGYNGTNGLNGINGTTGPVGFTSTAT